MPASPFLAIGVPSKQVHTDAGVPGMLKSIADMSPPLVPPIYSPISSDSPFTGVMLNVTGRKRATPPMVTVIPGIEPKSIPSTVPPNTKRMVCRPKTDIIPSIII